MAMEQNKGIEWQSLAQLAKRSSAAAVALRHLAAVVIQSHYRGIVVRRKYMFLIATRRAVDRAVPQLTLSLLEECYLGMCTAVVLEVMDESSSRQAAEQALQEEMTAVFQSIAGQVVYDEVCQYTVPKAIRESTDVLIRRDHKPTRINPLVALMEDLLNETGDDLVSQAVIGAIREVTDEYLLQAKARWVLDDIMTAVVQPYVQEWVEDEMNEFESNKERWSFEAIVETVVADVVRETHVELKRIDARDRKEEILKSAVTEHVNRVMWSRLAGSHLAELVMDKCSAIVVRRELRDVGHALATDRLLKLLDEGEAKVLRLRNNFMMRELLNNLTRNVIAPALIQELVKRLSESSS